MIAGAESAVIIGLSKSIDRQQARDLIEVRAGWSLVAAVGSGEVMSETVDRADLLIFDDTLSHVDAVLRAVRALSDPPNLAILTERSPTLVARELNCAPNDVVVLSPGVSVSAAMLRILASFESKDPRPPVATNPRRPTSGISAPSRTNPARSPTRVRASGPPSKRALLVIGSSTGGPDALGVLLAGLPQDFPAPILVTQHMPRTFTELLAATLDRSTPFTVREAKHGDVISAGCVYIAPGGSHMVITDRLGTLALSEEPPEHNCRPSVDVMFRSAAATFGGSCVAVVLTGMGSDGAIGAEQLADLGAHVIIQDRETSAVWGMPGAVAQRDVADQILPLREIAPAISRQFVRSLSAATPIGAAPSV